MLAKIIRSFYYILFFAVPLIVIPTTSELFELNKMVLIYAAALLVFCFGAVDAILTRRSPLEKSPMNIPFAAFFTVLTISLLFSIDLHTSMFGYYGRFNGGVLSIFAFITLYYGIVRYFTKEHVVNLLRLSVVTSALVMIWGLSGKLGHDFSCIIFTGHFDNSCWTDQFRPAERMFSTLGQPNWLGAYLAAQFFVGVYLYIVQTKERVNEWLMSVPYGIYIVITFMCLLFTRSRSALIAWGVGVAIFAVYSIIKHKKESLKPYGAVAVACVLAILVFKSGIAMIDRFITLPVPKRSPQVIAKSEPQLSSEVTESFDIRKIVWQGAWELGKKYPLFGTGPETFAYSYYFVRPQAHNMTSEWDYIYNKAHNEYLNYLATTGFTGLIAYLVVIGATIYLLYRGMIASMHGELGKPVKKALDPRLRGDDMRRDHDNAELFYLCLLCSYVTILITNFFGFSTSTSQLVFYLWPALAVVYAMRPTASASKKGPLGFWQYSGLTGVGIVGVTSLMWLMFFVAADLQYSQGVARLSQGEFQQAATHLYDAIKLHYEHVYEDRLSTSLANVALISAYGEKPELTDAFINQSNYYINHALSESPRNMLYWKTKGKNEYTFYQASPKESYLESAVQSLAKAYSLAPTEPKLPYTLGLLYGAMNKKSTSLEYIDKTIALKPDYRDAYFLKLKLLRAWKETAQAEELKKEIVVRFPGITPQEIDQEAK